MSPVNTKAVKPKVRLWSQESLACVVLLAVCLVLTWPVVETGINDDWCYTILAWDYGHTGHFIYRGWATASVGWQAIWGGIAARLLGYTYTVVRLSMWPITFATAVLFHAILRRFGVNRDHAIFGTLTFVLSPLFLPLADTFMTDVPGLFVLFLCIYLCQCALASTTDRQTFVWLTLAALSNTAFGTVRQITWLGILVIVPSCGFLLRRRRHVLLLTTALWLLGAACIVISMRWFKHQPYTVPEAIIPPDLNAKAWHKVATNFVRSGLTLALLCMPVFSSGVAEIRRFPRSFQWSFGAFASLLLLCTAWVPGRHLLLLLTPPWTGNILNKQGIMQGDLLFGAARSIPPIWLLVALLMLVFSVLAFLMSLAASRRTVVSVRPWLGETSFLQVSVICLPFAVAYCVLLFPRATKILLFDRYLLALIAVALVFLLRLHQDWVCRRMPLVSYGVLAISALSAVGGTHDLFAMERARVQLFDELQREGIPRTAIRGGFELDAATQVSNWGYFNDPHIVVPHDAFHPQPPHPREEVHPECVYALQVFVPVVHPRFALATEDSPCIVGRVIASVSYGTWLPFGTHSVVAGTPRYP